MIRCKRSGSDDAASMDVGRISVSYRTSSMWIVLVIAFMSITGLNSYPNGAVDSACSDMTPAHRGASAKSSPSPYSLTASVSNYTPGQQITVTLNGGSSSFKGFLIEARLSSSQETVGSFTNLPNNVQQRCANQAVTHTNSADKSTVTVSWIAPSTAGQGSIYFKATVVQDYTTYWSSIHSGTISEASGLSVSPSATVSTQSATSSSVLVTTLKIDTSACGQTKSCYRATSCSSDDQCDYLLTWTKTNDQSIEFEMAVTVSSADSWVAFGLSSDKAMSPASVVECISDDQSGMIRVRASQNVGYNNQLLNNDQLGLIPGSTSGGYNNGQIVCRFKRLIDVLSQQGRRRRRQSTDTVFPLNSNVYYILIAQGRTSAGVKQYHSAKTISLDPVNFTSTTYVSLGGSASGGNSLNLVKAHGIIMILAWMVFASSGMLMPRYCKLAWPDTLWLGKKVWFQIHQPFMIITLLLTSSGFILIFCEAGSYVNLTSPTMAHPPLGIIVMILVLANPIMAIFRCEPGAKNRPVFNVAHFIVGLLAHLTAVTTIFLGLYMTALNLPLWTKGVMALYICFHVLIEIVLAVRKHVFSRKTEPNGPEKPDSNSFPLESQFGSAAPADDTQQPKRSSSIFETVVIAVHLVGVAACAIAISVQIGGS